MLAPGPPIQRHSRSSSDLHDAGQPAAGRSGMLVPSPAPGRKGCEANRMGPRREVIERACLDSAACRRGRLGGRLRLRWSRYSGRPSRDVRATRCHADARGLAPHRHSGPSSRSDRVRHDPQRGTVLLCGPSGPRGGGQRVGVVVRALPHGSARAAGGRAGRVPARRRSRGGRRSRLIDCSEGLRGRLRSALPDAARRRSAPSARSGAVRACLVHPVHRRDRPPRTSGGHRNRRSRRGCAPGPAGPVARRVKVSAR